MKTASEIQIEALAMAYDSLRLYNEDMTQDGYELDTEREWVGLTQEELQDLCAKSYHTDNAGETHFNRGYFADAIEAKLKEKNR